MLNLRMGNVKIPRQFKELKKPKKQPVIKKDDYDLKEIVGLSMANRTLYVYDICHKQTKKVIRLSEAEYKSYFEI